jgi:hypothetical protein
LQWKGKSDNEVLLFYAWETLVNPFTEASPASFDRGSPPIVWVRTVPAQSLISRLFLYEIPIHHPDAVGIAGFRPG